MINFIIIRYSNSTTIYCSTTITYRFIIHTICVYITKDMHASAITLVDCIPVIVVGIVIEMVLDMTELLLSIFSIISASLVPLPVSFVSLVELSMSSVDDATDKLCCYLDTVTIKLLNDVSCNIFPL